MSKAPCPLKLLTPESSDGGIDGDIVVPEQNVLKAGYLLLFYSVALGCFAPLESAAHAVGKVSRGASKPVQHLEGGLSPRSGW